MTTTTKTSGFLFSLILSVAACGGGGADYDTVGDVIIAVGEAYCERAIDCGLITDGDRDQCESLFTQGACEAGSCGQEFRGDPDDVDACINAIDDFSCALVDEGEVPARCTSF